MPLPAQGKPDETDPEDRAKALSLIPVSRETTERLDQFVRILLEWQKRMNLVARSTIPLLWTRHVADSLQLLEIAPHARVWMDLGSGAGFPGLPIACAMADQSGFVHLVESNAKKAAFLSEVGHKLDLPIRVHHERIETLTASFSEPVDIVTARALAPLPELLEYVTPLVKSGAQALLHKGQHVEAELTAASKYWYINARSVPSKTESDARILFVSDVRRISREARSNHER